MPEEREGSREAPRATKGSPLARTLGIAAMLLACVFVWREMRDVGTLSLDVWRNPGAWIRLSMLGALYGAAGMLLAMSWVSLLNAGSWGTLAWRDGVEVFARTQLLKYLPSNVLHVAGRFAILRSRGVPNAAIIRSTGLEHLILAAVALALAGFFVMPNLHVWASELSTTPWLPFFAIGSCVLLVLLAGPGGPTDLYGRPRARFTQMRARALDELSLRDVARASLLYIGFFSTTGAIALTLARVGGSQAGLESFFIVTGTLALAWLAGFLTPGAPGGLGVREAVAVIGLEPLLGLEVATFVAVAYRFVTILGDLLLAGVGLGIARFAGPRETS